ncbi:MAG: sodium:solute symporter family protein [Ignavibacteriales bacterium]|nr:sodium:solute symporter family protein [Ignavibacteriales bacterium]
MDIYLIGVIVYLLILGGIGVYSSRSVKTQDDFMVAGRKTSALFLAGTLVCTWVGSGSLFGGAGLAFRSGISQLWMSAGAWVGIAIVYFLAHRVRRISQYTLSDILEQRYNATARLFGTTAIIIAYLTIAGYQFRGGGRLLNILTGIDPLLGGAITCAVVIGFTVLAGLVSIISIDLMNGIIMTLGVLIALPLAYFSIGTDHLVTLPADRFAVFGQENAVWAMGVFFPTFFLLMGESGMYQKFFSAKDESTARRAVVGMIVGVIIIETSLCLLAVVGSAKYLTLSPFLLQDGSLDKATTETIILHLARFDIPPVAGVLLICAAVAIILSTANTFLMIPSTNISRDIYQRFIRPDVSDRAIIRFQRFWIVGLGILAFVLANFFKSILDMAFTAYTMVGAGITPALLAAFLWKRVTVPGGVSSIVAGMGVTVIITTLNFILPEPLMETDYIILPAAGTSIVALIAVSLLTAPSPEEKWKPFVSNMQMNRQEQS